MKRNLRNTISVLAVTALTAGAVYVSVQFGLGTMLPQSASAQVLMCPATGCTASSCHATQGQPASATAGGSAASFASADAGGSLTCPATGCTASSCHATQGAGRGHGWAEYEDD